MFLRWMRLAGCGGSFKQVRDKPEPERDERARSSDAPSYARAILGDRGAFTYVCIRYLCRSLVYCIYHVQTCARGRKLCYLCFSGADIVFTDSLSLSGGFSSSPCTAPVLSSAAMPSSAWSTPMAFTASWSH